MVRNLWPEQGAGGGAISASAILLPFSKGFEVRIRVFVENKEELLVLLSVEVASFPRNSLYLPFICSSHHLPANHFKLQFKWPSSDVSSLRRIAFPLQCWPVICGYARTGKVHFLASPLSLDARKQRSPAKIFHALWHPCTLLSVKMVF